MLVNHVCFHYMISLSALLLSSLLLLPLPLPEVDEMTEWLIKEFIRPGDVGLIAKKSS